MGASGDCGCGCGGTKAAAATATPSAGALAGAAYLRPQFFADQLLTQDDLQGVVDYMLAKRRLTNRHLFGAGVVCGLDVSCHPCEPGLVRVQPGSALEDCGNDIVVPCPEDVDVLALVREYRQGKGDDCGDPCEQNPRRDFYLYIRYDEEPTAPLAPYAGDDCGAGSCEFSRYREGYRFELRCGPPAAEPTLCSALEALRPRKEDYARDKEQMLRALHLAERQRVVTERISADREPVPDIPTKAEFEAVEADGVALAKVVAVLKQANAIRALDEAATAGTVPSLGLNPVRRKMIADRSRALATRVLASPALARLSSDERARTEFVAKLAEEQRDLSGLSAVARAWIDEGVTLDEAERTFVGDAQRLKARVLTRLEESGRSRCQEAREVAKLRFDGLHDASLAATETLGRALVRSFDDGVCAAVNPPCPEGGDPAVLLAKVRVEGCEVTDVCSLERRFVLSPRAVGYWVPVVERFRTELAAVCCPTCDGAEEGGYISTKVRELGSEQSLASELGKLLKFACPPAPEKTEDDR